MALCCGGAWVEVLEDEHFGFIWAPFEDALRCYFQQGGDSGITKRLIGKFDSIGLHVHQVC